MDIRPNHTIYINNINDKIKKEGTGGCRLPLDRGGLWGLVMHFYTPLVLQRGFQELPEVSEVPSRRWA